MVADESRRQSELNRPRFRTALAAAWLLTAATLGCADGDRYLGREPVRFETEHFRYHADPTRQLCDQTGYWLERTYTALANYLEVPPQSSRKIDYYYTDQREIGLACGGIASGCTVGAEQIFSETELKRHELVHVVAAQKYGHALVLLDEGLAEMLACGVFPVIAPPLDKRLVPVETLLTLKEITGDGDPERSQNPRVIGRSLVKYLIERFGKTEFLDLYGALPAGTGLDETRAQFASRLGVSLDSVLRDWEGVEERSDESCVYLIECEDPPVSGRVDFVTSCGFGRSSSSGVRFFPFEVGESERVRLDFLGEDIDVRIASCNSGNFGLQARDAPFTQLLHAPAGRYFAQLSAAVGKAGAFEAIEPVPSVDACSADDPAPLGIGQDVVVSRRGVASDCLEPWCPGDRVELIAHEPGRLFPLAGWDGEFGVPPGKYLFRCDEACPADPSIACKRDFFVGGGGAEQTNLVIGSAVETGEILHLASGPDPDATISLVTYQLAPP